MTKLSLALLCTNTMFVIHSTAFIFPRNVPWWPQQHQHQHHQHHQQLEPKGQYSTNSFPCLFVSESMNNDISSRSKPRTGFFHSLLDLALKSPLWTYVLVPQARQKMMDTATSNGIPWMDYRTWIQQQYQLKYTNQQQEQETILMWNMTHIPSYYRQPFHAYRDGNLNWEAAWEAEIASAAVGARNFPAYGSKGEDAFRRSFQICLQKELGAHIPTKPTLCPQHLKNDAGQHNHNQNITFLDLGCGTGRSTRWWAEQYSSEQVDTFLGMDLSPYFIHVARSLLEWHPKSREDGGSWIHSIPSDSRIQYQVGFAEATGLPDNSVDIVNLQFVAHELPTDILRQVIHEAYRILRSDGNGQLWISEMDFETPAYAAQRANPFLFGLLRATEPYLDDYADNGLSILRTELQRLFVHTRIGAATGRHLAIVATKGKSDRITGAKENDLDPHVQEHVLEDLRFDENGIYKMEDTHLKVWENKL
jgi:ubiquinone/menaquinone biosynthesis C-methylase UbiE